MPIKKFTKLQLKKEIARQYGVLSIENFQNIAQCKFRTAYIFETENLTAFRHNTGNMSATVRDMNKQQFLWIHVKKVKISGKWVYSLSYCTDGYGDYEIHEVRGKEAAHKDFYDMMAEMFKANKAKHEKTNTGAHYLSEPIKKIKK